MSSSSQLTYIEAGPALQPLVAAIAIGQDPTLEAQLIQKSLQPDILKFTPNDSKQRFGSMTMLQNWRAKGREVHWLLGAGNDLAGIIWYGRSPFPLEIDMPEVPEETFAIRIYEGYAGHGLAVPFMLQSLRLLVQTRQQQGLPISGLWLQTDIANIAANKVYTRAGYREVSRDDKRVTMVIDRQQMLAAAAA